jgi:hypothetical protein
MLLLWLADIGTDPTPCPCCAIRGFIWEKNCGHCPIGMFHRAGFIMGNIP